jgi:hypothetical protein
MGSKNDYNEARAIAETLGRPKFRFVAVKTQQAMARPFGADGTSRRYWAWCRPSTAVGARTGWLWISKRGGPACAVPVGPGCAPEPKQARAGGKGRRLH